MPGRPAGGDACTVAGGQQLIPTLEGPENDRYITIPLDFNPEGFSYSRPIDVNLGSSIPGLDLTASGNFSFSIDPAFRTRIGLRVSSGVPLAERAFIVADEEPEVSLTVSANLNPTLGGINGLIRWLLAWFGVEGVKLPMWIWDPAWSKPSLIIMNVWAAGSGMIIWLAGLQSIPPQLYEAAAIDGAGKWRQFWHVTMPMLTPYILFNFVIGLIGTMQILDEAYIMTKGGPVDSTLFYAYYLFRQAFQFFRMGYAAALAWILFVVVLALTMLQLWMSKKWVHYEQA